MGQWNTKTKDDPSMHTPTHQAFKLPPDFDPRSPTSEYNRTPILVDDAKKKKKNVEERMHRKVLKKIDTPIEQVENQMEAAKFDLTGELNSADANAYNGTPERGDQKENSSPATNSLEMSSDEPAASPASPEDANWKWKDAKKQAWEEDWE